MRKLNRSYRLFTLSFFFFILAFFQNCDGRFESLNTGRLSSSSSNDRSPPETPPSSNRGFLSTAGNQIVDDAGNPVRLSGVNWQGFEQDVSAPAGLYARNYRELLEQIKGSGFNVIRLPFSREMLGAAVKTKGSGFTSHNPELVSQSPLEILDAVIDYAGSIGLRVILDFHRRKADTNYEGTEKSGLWYDTSFSEQDWIATWVTLAKKYRGNPTVIGADLWNEPHSTATSTVTWGGGGAKDWARAAEAAASAILKENPDWLIIVAGISGYQGLSGAPDSTLEWWGQNLQGVKTRPVIPVVNGKPITNKVVYSPHIYPRGVVGRNSPLMTATNYPANLPEVWTSMWGYIYLENKAPIWVGEVAANLTGRSSDASCTFNDPTEPQWAALFLSYINGDINLDGKSDLGSGQLGMSWAWWTFGYDICGRYLFNDVDFQQLDGAKLQLMTPALGKLLDH